MAASLLPCAEERSGGPVSPSVSVESCIPAAISRTTTNCAAGKITALFENITISSNFDSGNLARAEECRSHDGPGTREFDLWTACDCADTEFRNGNKTWFYFSVCTPQNFCDRALRFNIRNLNRQSRLYQQGLTPITKTVPGRSGWERLRSRVEYENTEEGTRITFQITISDNRRLTTYFAFCYPYSYSECQRRLTKLDDHYRLPALTPNHETHEMIYYHRELLCNSIEGRRIDLITVTSCEGMTGEKEARLPHLFPDQMAERCCVFKNKKVVFVSSRVHPGETPSSHVFNGLLTFLLRPDDPRAVAVRKKFVFKLVPMLNPDGVFRGHYRTDTKGANLNRYYMNPDPVLHPSIYAAKSLILYYHQHHQGHSSSVHTNGDIKRATMLSSKSCNFHSESSSITDRLMSQYRGSELSNSLSSFSSSPSNSDAQVSSQASSLFALAARSGNKALSSCPTLEARCEGARASPLISHSLKPITEQEDGQCDSMKCSQRSGVALYVDLHAHAAKRGVFMYGNYFSYVAAAAENMLFPKLLSLNSPHLDFDQCVFSEKNMYTTDKRDGMSKEGSGRVAIHKATGIIPCYTLECNYNSGRQCNTLPEATLDDGRASPASAFSPITHRFSIADFEQVGRALVYSLLDLHQLNPWTRLPSTSFGSVAGVRQALLHRVRTSRTKKINTPEANPGMPVNEKASACIPNDGVTVATKPQGVATFPTQSPLGHSKPLLGTGISRSGKESEWSLLAEARQQKRVSIRANGHLSNSVMATYSKASFRNSLSFTTQSMKPSPTNVVFPSPLATSLKNVSEVTLLSSQPGATSSHSTAVSRRPVRSAKRAIPLMKDGVNAHKLMSLQASSNLGGRNVKGSILITNSPQQRNYVPPIEYYAKGSLLVPERAKCRNPGHRSKKLSSIDPVLSPDQALRTSASH